MIDIFPLPLFPEGGLTQSVVTTVWVGLFVVAFFNLRLGWTLSGLVIPGYIVPLMLARPWSAAVIFIEGILTYFLVWLFSEYFSKYGKWSSLFGRDRFFALVVASLAVRIVMDGWFLGELGKFLNDQLGINFDYSNNLRSFGLIITALIANYFWKPGLKKGLFSLLVITGISLLLVRYVLMELTNFNIGRIEYMFEDLGAFFLASPKAYIIIVITSFIASRMNLNYGWEYSGIMIPSLLALQWYQPIKLVATLVESIIVLSLAILVLKLPMFREKTIEGARKILLFFNIAFLYKFILGHILIMAAPHLRITDAYGFGYLLTSLIAIKMHEKSFLPQMVRSLFQTSLAAVLLASGVGFGLIYLSDWLAPMPPYSIKEAIPPGQIRLNLVESIRKEKLALYQKRSPESVQIPSPAELELFGTGLNHLVQYTRDGHPTEELEKAVYYFSQVNYRIDRTPDDYLILREARNPRKGGGVYVFREKTKKTGPTTINESFLVFEIPAPLDEGPVLEAGTWLFREMNGFALGVAGSSRKTNQDNSADVLTNPYTFFHVFHRVVGAADTLQIRSYTPETRRALSGQSSLQKNKEPESSLWVKRQFPPGLSLASLKKLIKTYSIQWNGFPMKNIQRQYSNWGFAELFLDPHACRSAMISALTLKKTAAPMAVFESVDSYLRKTLLETKGEIAEKGSNSYKPFSTQELMFIDMEILTPLMKLMKNRFMGKELTAEGQEELSALNAAASIVGYRLALFRHTASREIFIIMEETEKDKNRRFTGTYIFRPGNANPFFVQVPRPLFEKNSFEYGIYLFDSLNATVLATAGAHPHANRDLSSDPIRLKNKSSLFNLVTQIFLRETATYPVMVVSCRAFSFHPDRPEPQADAFLATSDWSSPDDKLSPNGRLLLQRLKSDGLTVLPVNGQQETTGYEVGIAPTPAYLPLTINKEFAILWLSPELRRFFGFETAKRIETTQFTTLGIETIESDLYDFLEKQIKTGHRDTVETLPEDIRGTVLEFLQNRDIVLLENLAQNGKGYTVRRVIDTDSRRPFLVFLPPGKGMPTVVNLTPRLSQTHAITKRGLDRTAVRRFIDMYTTWLQFAEEP